MRIVIDYTAALRQRAGIGRFTRELVQAVVAAGSPHQFVLLAPRSEPPELSTIPPGTTLRRLPVNARTAAILWHRLHLPLPAEIFTGGCDLFHAPDYVLPPLRRARSIVTVHDLGFVQNPGWSVPSLARYLANTVPAAVRRADLVLADSAATKQDLIAWLGVDPAKVEVLYGGVAGQFRPVDDLHELQRVRASYKLDRPYLLTVSTLEPRKNLVRLLEAYALLRSRRAGTPDLVIAGGRGWLYEDIYQRANDLQLSSAVRFLGFVPDEDLPALLTQSTAFVFPSLYEGFGLPPLEAMACGVPVAASNAPCLPEVLGDAALYFDPNDVESIAETLSRVLSDAALRTDLVARGRVRVQQFQWGHAARQLITLYERLGTA